MLQGIAKFKDLIAIPSPGSPIGFHARNMQVAHLDAEALAAFANPQSETRAELEAWNDEVDTAATDADIEQHARSLMINVSQVCNLHCSYCAAGGDGSFGDPLAHVDIEKIYQQARMILHDLNRGDVFTLTFFGGEPLVAPETIKRLARYARLQTAGRGIDLRFSIITNATLINAENAELLASLGCHVTVSLDGPPMINDRFRVSRSGRGSTDRVLKGLAQLQKVRSRLGSLVVGAVFGRHHTDVLTTYKYLRTLNFDSYRFDFAVGADEGEAASLAYATALSETAEFALAEGGEDELRKIEQFDSYFRALDSQRRLHNHCGAGKSLLSIDGRGRMTSCQWFVGRDEEQLGANGALDHEKLKGFAGRINELNGCQGCWARHLCGGGCMHGNLLATGSKHEKDPIFCNRIQTTIAKAIEVYARARYQQT